MLKRISLLAVLAAPGATWAGEEDLASCGGGAFVAFIGQPIEDVQGAWPEKTRVLSPDSVVTADYLADRLNVDLDERGVIIALRCG